MIQASMYMSYRSSIYSIRSSSATLRRLPTKFKESRRTFVWSSRQQQQQQQQQNYHYSSSSNTKDPFQIRDAGLEFTSVVSHPGEVDGPDGIPSRSAQLSKISNTATTFDVIVVGGGATGAGVALDAASRGYTVCCLERGDFASETSSRSTKLIWAGIKYMGSAVAGFLSWSTLSNPSKAISDFWGEMKLVYNCHRERRYMIQQQKHLCEWLPIAIPFDRWHVSPPPFGHALYGFFPILAPFVLKFYDALSFFQCPPSYFMTPGQTAKVFPQLDTSQLKYCAVFYEAVHNDSRTNLSIAMTAAEKGAAVINYVEVVDTITSQDNTISEETNVDNPSQKVIGVVAIDRMTGNKMEIKGKTIIFCGGPFTDNLRALEPKSVSKPLEPAVRGAHGTHVVLSGDMSSSTMGLLDFNTSDGRFLFIIPWQGHTLIGTTDTKSPAQTLPQPPDEDIRWILNESSKYYSHSTPPLSAVMSAWRGWRPLAVDPNAAPGSPVSRDHVISQDPSSGVYFIAGGKWTTWREMAQDVVDRALGTSRPCHTLTLPLVGAEGYSESLIEKVMQRYNLSQNVAKHLVRTYGGRVWEVCHPLDDGTTTAQLLHPDYPYLELEVKYACREYACTIEDVLSRRTRLAFLNREAALQCIPRVAELMTKELQWTKDVTKQQINAANSYIGSYGGGSHDDERETNEQK